jgi:hypothetical protein
MPDEPRFFLAKYTDEDITGELAPALRERGFEAQSTIEAGLLNSTDEEQLAYATSRGMVLLTCNARDFLLLGIRYVEANQHHAGIIVSAEQYSRKRFGEFLHLVLHILNIFTADELRDCVVYLQQVPL